MQARPFLLTALTCNHQLSWNSDKRYHNEEHLVKMSKPVFFAGLFARLYAQEKEQRQIKNYKK